MSKTKSTSNGVLDIDSDRTRQTIVVQQNLSTTGSRPFIVNFDSYQISFRPTKMIIRQIIYCNISGADNGTFLLYCNLTGQNVAACYVGIQSNAFMPNSIVNLKGDVQTVEFQLQPAVASFVPTGQPSGSLTLTLELVE